VKLSSRALRSLLISTFIGVLALQLALVSYACAAEKIYLENLKSIVVGLLVAYSVPLSIITAGIFSKGGASDARAPAATALTALALSVLWNLLFAGRVGFFAFSSADDVDELLDWFTTLSAGGSFLIAAALTFYFSAKEPSPMSSRTT
jgi:hypothetical protein